MRIISRFRDYYDSVQVYGTDPAVIYVRETRRVQVAELDDEVVPRLEALSELAAQAGRFDTPFYREDYHGAVLAFCGRAISCHQLGVRWASSAAQVRGLFDLPADTPARGELSFPRWGGLLRPYFNLAAADWLEAQCAERPVPDSLHVDLQCPVFLLHPWRGATPMTVELNPMLRPMGVASVIDPYTAWQQLSNYLNGPLTGLHRQHPNDQIDDRTMARKKGFDEASFRGRPAKKRKRKKR